MDAIVVRGQQAVAAAKRATGAIPIIMSGVADPVGTGMVASLAHLRVSRYLSPPYFPDREYLIGRTLPSLFRQVVQVVAGAAVASIGFAQYAACKQVRDVT